MLFRPPRSARQLVDGARGACWGPAGRAPCASCGSAKLRARSNWSCPRRRGRAQSRSTARIACCAFSARSAWAALRAENLLTYLLIAKQFIFDDWKRIKPKKDVRAGARAYADRRCKPPLSTYPQNEHTQFSIQLSLYREMLARGTGIELSSIERLGPDGLPAGPSCIVRMHRDLSPGPRGVAEAEQVPVRHMGREARTLLQMELEQRLCEREEAAGERVAEPGPKRRKLVMDPSTGRFADARAVM